MKYLLDPFWAPSSEKYDKELKKIGVEAFGEHCSTGRLGWKFDCSDYTDEDLRMFGKL